MKYFIKKILSLSFILLIANISFSQDNGEEGKKDISEFRGGTRTLNVKISSNLLYGLGASSLGTISSDFNENAGAIYWNPSALSLISRAQFFIDVSPPVTYDLNRISELATGSQVKDEIRNSIDDKIKKKTEKDGFQYSKANFNLGMANQVNSVCVALPFQYLTVGASYYQPLDMEIDFLISGLALRSTFEEGDTKGDFYLSSVDMNTKAKMNIAVYSIAIAPKFKNKNKWSVGITFDNYRLDASMDGSYLIDGFINVQGNENVFNDSNAPWKTDFNSFLKSGFKGSAFGTKLGARYVLSQKWILDGMINVVTSSTMKGSLVLDENVSAIMNFDTESGSLKIDVGDNLSQLTITKNMTTTSKFMVVNFPSSINIGISYKSDNQRFKTALSFGQYFGEATYHYKATVVDSEDVEEAELNNEKYEPLKVDYTQGFQPISSVNFGMAFGYIRLATGVILVKEIKKGFKKNPKPMIGKGIIPLPTFSLGIGYSFNKTVGLDAYLFMASAPFMRVSLTFTPY
jgi:hypothetical protein